MAEFGWQERELQIQHKKQKALLQKLSQLNSILVENEKDPFIQTQQEENEDMEKDWAKKQEIAEYQKKQRAEKERKENDIKKVCILSFIRE